MGAVEWYESELWHSGGNMRGGLCDHYYSAALWKEIKRKERCSALRDRLVCRYSEVQKLGLP
jgi:hypothetical protein